MHICLDIKVDYAFTFVSRQKHDPVGDNLGEKINVALFKAYFVLRYTVALLTCLSTIWKLNVWYFSASFLGWVLLQMHFIILHRGNSFVLKSKKWNQGVDKNFPRYCKLMLWLSVLGAMLGSWLAGGQSEGNFSRPSIVYSEWLSTKQLEVCTSFSWPSERTAIGK